MPRAIGVGVQRIAVATQRADRKAVVIELFFEAVELDLVVEHRQFAVRIAGIVARTEFHGVHIERREFLKNTFQREVGQQRRKDTNSHFVPWSSAAPAGITAG